MTQTLCPSITGNLEAIEQGLAFFQHCKQSDYTYSAKPYVDSSMGQHLRHILDLYRAVINAANIGVVDYDARRRGAKVETELSVGVRELTEIKEWLLSLDEDKLDHPLPILSEATLATQQICEMTSSLRRELLFTASHTIHHYAMIKTIGKHRNIELNESFGFAPSTSTYLRGRA